MNLLSSNVIKAKNIKIKGKKVLKTFQDTPQNQGMDNELNYKLEEEFAAREEEIKLKLEEAESKYNEILESAQLESERLIQESKQEVENIEKKAYEQGHSQGLKNGYEDGYKEAYEDNIEKAKEEAEKIIQNANNILIEAKYELENYIKNNKANILDLSISIAEQVLREKFSDPSSMNNLLDSIIEEYSLKENFVVKVNPLYKENLDSQILELKEDYKINGDVFILSDESVEEGNAIIDSSKGRLVIGIDSVLDKVKEELLWLI